MVGGRTWSRRASAVMIASSAPAAPNRWPVIDPAETQAIRQVAERCAGAVGVDVADLFGADPRVLQRVLEHADHAAAAGVRRGHVVGVVGGAVAGDLRVDL